MSWFICLGLALLIQHLFGRRGTSIAMFIVLLIFVSILVGGFLLIVPGSHLWYSLWH
jgi:hypothetical protein